jgi:predicted metal-dependent phosphoesterase TrpH
VPPQWCTIKQAIDVIHHSGGKAVIAHPGRYDLSAKWLKRLLAHFSEQGGDAMEVAQCQQAPHERAQLATLAVQFGLLASQGPIFISPARGSNLAVSSGFLPAWKASGTAGKRPPNKN